MAGEGTGVCCNEVVTVKERVSVMEAINKVDKWWVRAACGFVILVIPFLWNKLDGIESKVGDINTNLEVHMESIDAHAGRK